MSLALSIYRRKVKETNGVSIWIVDGAAVRRELFGDFMMGGHAGRYLFVPKDEVWIDATVSLEELDYTIAHELLERDLMMNQACTYNDAHDRALELELETRKKDHEEAERQDRILGVPKRGAWWIYQKDEQENP